MSFPRFQLAAVLCLVGLAFASSFAIAQELKELDSVDVKEHFNAQLPLDTKFRDDRGEIVRLSEFFQGDRPVILSLNYSNCPLLCQTQLTGLVRTLREIPGDAGDQFEFISISIDPTEPYERARKTKERYFAEYRRPGTSNGWHFLVGEITDIRRVADTVGFSYNYLPDRKEYVHPAVAMICTPDGRISRYLYGVDFDEQTVRLSLVEASEGKIGTPLEKVLLFCFMYDETAGRYAPVAINIMQIGGGVTVTCLIVGLVPYWLMRRRKQGSTSPATSMVDERSVQSRPI